MNLENFKVIVLGAAIAFSGGLLRVLISIQNKEKKQPWEHLVTLLIVIVVGVTMSYVMHKADVNDKWYSTGLLFVLGYGYDKFLKMINTNLPNWIDKAVTAYIEKTYGVNKSNNSKENEEEKEIDKKQRNDKD